MVWRRLSRWFRTLVALRPRRPGQIQPSKFPLEDAAILLMSLPQELSAACFPLLGTEQMHRITLTIGKLPPISRARRAEVGADFQQYMTLTCLRLGVKKSVLPDADLVVRTLCEFYLPPASQKPPAALSMNPAKPRTRRKIYSCSVCDEVFIDVESLSRHKVAAHMAAPGQPEPKPADQQPAEPEQKSLTSLMQVDVLGVHLGSRLMGLVDPSQGAQLKQRMTSIERHMALELGLLVPEVRLLENPCLEGSEYHILVNDCVVARGMIRVNQFLAIGPEHKLKGLRGEDVLDPTYQMPGKWISPAQRGDAERLGCMLFDPVSVVATQLTEVVRKNAAQLLSLADVRSRLDDENMRIVACELAAKGADLVVIWKVLRGLLREQVSIRDLTTILEAIAENLHLTRDPAYLIEFVRIALGGAICADLANDQNVLNVITLDDRLEQLIREAELDFQLGADILGAIGDQIFKVQELGLTTILLTGPVSRARLHKLLSPSHPDLKVLSWNEIAPPYSKKVNSIAMASL